MPYSTFDHLFLAESNTPRCYSCRREADVPGIENSINPVCMFVHAHLRSLDLPEMNSDLA